MACAVDWSSLPSELVDRVADVFLATSDVDYYDSLRAVCRNWRAATDDPRGPDARFRPHRWVMLDELADPDADVSRLFLNVETGRFLRRDNLPALRCYIHIASVDGLLVLRHRGSETKLCVLNPLTGAVVSYHAAVHVQPRDIGLAVVGSSPMVLTIFGTPCHGACFDSSPSTPMFAALRCVSSVASFRGRVYAADHAGSVAAVNYPAGPDTIVAGDRRADTYTFLVVDSAGDELLLVRAWWSPTSAKPCLKVFRVDLARNALEPVTSIGNRALVLGVQSVSVDADNVHGLEGNCIYYGNGLFRKMGICVHRIDDASEEIVVAHPADEERLNGLDRGRVFPLPLAQLLVISAWPFRDIDLEGC